MDPGLVCLCIVQCTRRWPSFATEGKSLVVPQNQGRHSKALHYRSGYGAASLPWAVMRGGLWAGSWRSGWPSSRRWSFSGTQCWVGIRCCRRRLWRNRWPAKVPPRLRRNSSHVRSQPSTMPSPYNITTNCRRFESVATSNQLKGKITTDTHNRRNPKEPREQNQKKRKRTQRT
jgi:hypothetical protein